jgi:hypothetical protein
LLLLQAAVQGQQLLQQIRPELLLQQLTLS